MSGRGRGGGGCSGARGQYAPVTARPPPPPHVTMPTLTTISSHLATLAKRRLRLLRLKNTAARRPAVTEEEMDNIANEALEAVLHCR